MLSLRRRVSSFSEFFRCLVRIEGMETRHLLGYEASEAKVWRNEILSQDDVLEKEGWHIDGDKLRRGSPTAFLSVSWLSGKLEAADQSDSCSVVSGSCREVYHRIARIPSQSPIAGRHEIRVSMVQVGLRSYVSGVRYYCSGSEGPFSTSLGFCALPDEQVVVIPPGAILRGIDVAFSIRGLVGIKFDFVGVEDTSSPWIGQNEGEGIAYGVLKLPEQFSQYYLVAGLDVFSAFLIMPLYLLT